MNNFYKSNKRKNPIFGRNGSWYLIIIYANWCLCADFCKNIFQFYKLCADSVKLEMQSQTEVEILIFQIRLLNLIRFIMFQVDRIAQFIEVKNIFKNLHNKCY